MTGLFLSLGVGRLLTVVLPLLSFVWASEARFRAQRIEDRLRRIEERLVALTTDRSTDIKAAAPAGPGDAVVLFETLAGPMHGGVGRASLRVTAEASGAMLRFDRDDLFDLIGQ